MTREEKIELLFKANESFYKEGIKILSDENYHALKQELGIPDFDTDIEIDPSLKVKHEYPTMSGTLAKVNSIEDAIIWAKKFPESQFAVSVKYDGFSLVVEYEANGNYYFPVKALSRGKNGYGKDLLPIVKANINDIPIPHYLLTNDSDTRKENHDLSKIAVSYEMVIFNEDFDNLLKNEKVEYKNPRNAISGLLADIKLSKYLTFIPLKIVSADDKQEKFLDRNFYLDYIFYMTTSENITSNRIKVPIFMPAENIQELEALLKAMSENRYVDCMNDGLVIEVLDDDRIEKYGYMDSEKTTPKFAIAYKFPALDQETELLDIEWYVEGYNPTYTPVSVFKPVVLNGNTYERVSLSNYALFKEGNYKKGDKLLFELRNDVLGYINKIEDNSDGEVFVEPTKCECGANLINSGRLLICSNDKPLNCRYSIIGGVMKIIDTLDMKFIGREIVTKLVDAKIIKNPYEIVTLCWDSVAPKFLAIEGLGEITLNKLKQFQEELKIKGINDYDLLASANIPFLNTSRSKKIVSNYKGDFIKDYITYNYENDDEETLKKMFDTLVEIENIGDLIALAILKSPAISTDVIFELDKKFKIIHSEKASNEKETFIVCHTGSSSPFDRRSQLQDFIESKGGKLASGVSNKIKYLINNDINSNSSKNKKAKELNIPIINVEEFIKLFD